MLEDMLMNFDPRKVLKDLEERGFEYTWSTYSQEIPRSGPINLPVKKDKCAHMVMETLMKIREAFLELGFEEIINPMIIDESEVYKQYGPEAPVILDRIFYLAGLPRPDIGLDAKTEEKIRKVIGKEKISKLKRILREYRERKIDADELIETLKKKLEIGDSGTMEILKIFNKFFKLSPEPTTQTLRSHMTGAWFSTIRDILEYRNPPLYLFSIDWVFRREQRIDKKHLRYYHSASVVVVDYELNEQYAFELTKRILNKIQEKLNISFKELKTIKRKDTARYYAKDKEWEVYVKFGKEFYEIGTFGFYNPISLARYEIPYFVYNFGMGLERIIQIITGEQDIRKVVFPYKYMEPNDNFIVENISVTKEPRTAWGEKLYETLISQVENYKDKVGPFKEIVYEDEALRIYFLEPDEKKKFLGPAAFNKVYLKDKALISTTQTIEGGTYIGRYIDLILKSIVREIEEGKTGLFKIRWVYGPSDINLAIPRKVLKLLKRTDIKGPVFLDIYVEKKDGGRGVKNE